VLADSDDFFPDPDFDLNKFFGNFSRDYFAIICFTNLVHEEKSEIDLYNIYSIIYTKKVCINISLFLS
jgi:hypothetical protein